MRRTGISTPSGDADSLQTFIRRAASEVQRWNNASREYEKKAKRAKQLALDSGIILAELSGLDESNPDDIATARRLVQKLDSADLMDPVDTIPIIESEDIGAKKLENTQAEEIPKQVLPGPNKKRKREIEPKIGSNTGMMKNDEMDIVIEHEDSAPFAAHDDDMTLEAISATNSPMHTVNRTPAKSQRAPASPRRGNAPSSAHVAPIDSESIQSSLPPSKKAKNNDVDAPVPMEPSNLKKSAPSDVSPAAKKASSTLKALAQGKKAAAPPEAPAIQRGMLDTFADRKSVRTLRGRDSTLQACHKQKPRCIVFSPTVQDTFATSSLDGTICFWKKRPDAQGSEKRCEEFGFLDRAKLRHSRFPADMCWHDSGNRLAVLFSYESADDSSAASGANSASSSFLSSSKKDDKVENAQLVIFNTKQLPNVPAFFLPNKPHKKEPKRVIFLDEDKLITSASDHNVVLWDIDYSEKSAQTSVLHSIHTAEVYSVSYSKKSNLLFSGGADKRFVAYNLGSRTPVMQSKLESKITHLVECPSNPNILMLNLGLKKDQIQLYDTRSNKFFLKLNWTMGETASTSQYIIPSWSPSGDLIACGAIDPVVNIWDLRYSKVHEPSMLISDAHSLRVLRAEFHPHYHNTLVTLSSDKQLGWHTLDIV